MNMPKIPHFRIEYALALSVFLMLLIFSSIIFFYLGSRSVSSEAEELSQLRKEVILQSEEIQRLKLALLQYESGNIIDMIEDPEDENNESPLGSTYNFQSDTGLVQFNYPKDWVLNKRRDTSTGSTNAFMYTLTSPSGSKLIYHESTSTKSPEDQFCNSTDPSGSYNDDTNSCVFFRDNDTQFARYKKLELSIPEGEWFLTESVGNGIYQADPESYFTYEIEDVEDLEIMDDILVTVVRKK